MLDLHLSAEEDVTYKVVVSDLDFKRALDKLKEGLLVRRPNYTSVYTCNKTGMIYEVRDHFDAVFTMEDYDALDWQVVEPTERYFG
jgi:hypothetical protein